MKKLSFRNKDRNNATLQTLASALTNRDKSNINTGGISQPQGGGNSNDNSMAISDGMNSLINGGVRLYGGLKNSGIFNGGSEGSGLFSSAANDYISGTGASNGIFGDAAGNYINGVGGGESAISSAIGSEVGSGAGSSGGGFGSGLPWGMIANMGKGLYNNISGKTPKEYSDLEQSTIFPLQGAANGFSLGGPWGALGGALYGLGYSFKDDLGLKDSNFFTQMTFPIGMGDGGGLRINGEPILDIL